MTNNESTARDDANVKVLLVGSAMHFISGLSYYTYFLAKALAERHELSVVLMRALIPRFLYPGGNRVGRPITELTTADVAPTFDGVNWWVVPSLMKAVRFARRQRPDVIVLQWWSATCLPAYWSLARLARNNGAKIIFEFHEDLHQAEARIPVLGSLARRGYEALIRRCDAYVVHSNEDRDRFVAKYTLDPSLVEVIPVGPFALVDNTPEVVAHERSDTTILFFGTIRPYKGLEYLVDAFDHLMDENPTWRLLVVGEPWEDWTAPFERIAASRHRDRIELIDHYVRDDEISGFFARADLVALPYLESMASGPLHMTMAAGLPVVTTRVGGLIHATADYEGAVLVEPADAISLAHGIERALGLVGRRFDDPHSWETSEQRFHDLFIRLSAPRS